MAENTYNWQSMDYKELSFVDKHLDMSLPEQAMGKSARLRPSVRM